MSKSAHVAIVRAVLPLRPVMAMPVGLYGESKLGRQVDALALGGDEGRDKLR